MMGGMMGSRGMGGMMGGMMRGMMGGRSMGGMMGGGHAPAYDTMIARDTVEEKVLELQQSKRDLAASIITADNSLIRTLTREDLELLLS